MAYVGRPSPELESNILDMCDEIHTLLKGKDPTVAANACLRYGVALLYLGGVTQEQARQGVEYLLDAYLTKAN